MAQNLKILNHRFSLYLINLFVSFHYFLILFINSTYLDTYVSTETLTTLYILGSLLAVGVFLVFPGILKRIGNFYFSLIFILFEILSLIGLAFTNTPFLVITSFILYLAVSHVIYLNLDIFLEEYTTKESSTGSIRGLFLSMQNITQIICPVIVGLILYDSNYRDVYTLSLIFLAAALLITLLNFRDFKDPQYIHSDYYHMWKKIWMNATLRKVIATQSILRFFYAWMVIYVPVYLYEYVGFTWQQLGFIFSIMLLPFLLLELPLGKMADKKIGEKEIMITGFIIMIITVALMPYITTPVFIWWAALLFVSRIGAASVEISTESYFFKHIDGRGIDVISFFRMTRPLMYIKGALIGGLAIKIFGFQSSFYILSLIICSGVILALTLKDTR